MINTVKKDFDENRGVPLESYQVVMQDGTELAVPNNPTNRHYKMIQEWVAKGNTIEEGAN